MDEAEIITVTPDRDNLVRLANHFMEKVVTLTKDALVGNKFDKVALHIAAKKTQEILQQLAETK